MDIVVNMTNKSLVFEKIQFLWRGQIIHKWTVKIISLLRPSLINLLLLPLSPATVANRGLLTVLKYGKLSPAFRPLPMLFPLALFAWLFSFPSFKSELRCHLSKKLPSFSCVKQISLTPHGFPFYYLCIAYLLKRCHLWAYFFNFQSLPSECKSHGRMGFVCFVSLLYV